MKNFALYGDHSADAPGRAGSAIDPGRWPDLVVDPRWRLEASARYLGYTVRRDGWAVRDHAKPWHLLYLIVEGQAAARFGNQRHRLGPGELMWIGPGVRFDMRWSRPFTFAEVWFNVYRGGRQLRLAGDHLLCSDAGSLLPWFRHIEDEAALRRHGYEGQFRRLLALLLGHIDRLGRDRPDPRRLSAAQRNRLAQHVHQNLHRRIRLSELAGAADLSADYFSRVFRRTYGCSPCQWMIRRRIEAAQRLLIETNQPIARLAEQLGYTNTPQFNRQFKKITGASPRAYRQRH